MFASQPLVNTVVVASLLGRCTKPFYWRCRRGSTAGGGVSPTSQPKRYAGVLFGLGRDPLTKRMALFLSAPLRSALRRLRGSGYCRTAECCCRRTKKTVVLCGVLSTADLSAAGLCFTVGHTGLPEG